jgi:hypothetical protein
VRLGELKVIRQGVCSDEVHSHGVESREHPTTPSGSLVSDLSVWLYCICKGEGRVHFSEHFLFRARTWRCVQMTPWNS